MIKITNAYAEDTIVIVGLPRPIVVRVGETVAVPVNKLQEVSLMFASKATESSL